MDAIIFFYKKRELDKPLLTITEEKGYRLIKVGICGGEDSWFGKPIPMPPAAVAGKDVGGEKVGIGERDTAERGRVAGRRNAAERRGVAGRGSAAGRRDVAGRGNVAERRDVAERGSAAERGSTAGRRDVAERGKAAEERKAVEKGDMTGQADGTSRKESFWKSLFSCCRERRRRREEMQEGARQQERYEKLARVLEEEVGELSEAILSKTEALDECFCVYMDGVRPLLTGEGLVAGMWKRCWTVPEFVDYRAYKWAAFLLPHAANTDFVLLGTGPCISEVLKACARSMKSLRWILREKDYNEEVEDCIEEFYEEYGLAAIVQTVAGRNGFRSLCLETARPVCVLDFTDEVKFFWGGLASGSVWLDFASLEEKQRRLERLAPGIAYFSLKKLWLEVRS